MHHSHPLLPLILAVLAASSLHARTWTAVETARDNGHRLTAIRVSAAADAATPAITLDPAQIVLHETDAPASFTLIAGGEALACAIPARAIQTYAGTTH